MNVTLNRSQIDDAIELGQASLSRFAGVPGRYSNTFNSHTLGRFGEIGVASLFDAHRYNVLPHYRDLASLRMCDVEVLGSVPYSRLEVKTWGAANWEDLGRCVHVGQLPKIQESADAVVWCTVPLVYLRSASDLSHLQTLSVTIIGFSLPSDIAAAPINVTGRTNARQVKNYQVQQSTIRNALELTPKV